MAGVSVHGLCCSISTNVNWIQSAQQILKHILLRAKSNCLSSLKMCSVYLKFCVFMSEIMPQKKRQNNIKEAENLYASACLSHRITFFSPNRRLDGGSITCEVTKASSKTSHQRGKWLGRPKLDLNTTWPNVYPVLVLCSSNSTVPILELTGISKIYI